MLRSCPVFELNWKWSTVREKLHYICLSRKPQAMREERKTVFDPDGTIHATIGNIHFAMQRMSARS
jgi:hypothetical protein